jgi:hypothetical protein
VVWVLCQGTTFVVPQTLEKMMGFSPLQSLMAGAKALNFLDTLEGKP